MWPQSVENAAECLALKLCGTKNAFFEKRTGEVVENKRKDYTDSPDRTGKIGGKLV